MFYPVFSGLQTVYCPLSTTCRISLDSLGVERHLIDKLLNVVIEYYHSSLRNALLALNGLDATPFTIILR